jgi:hypothetical protein
MGLGPMTSLSKPRSHLTLIWGSSELNTGLSVALATAEDNNQTQEIKPIVAETTLIGKKESRHTAAKRVARLRCQGGWRLTRCLLGRLPQRAADFLGMSEALAIRFLKIAAVPVFLRHDRGTVMR